jgi:phage baseplate assembly protein W
MTTLRTLSGFRFVEVLQNDTLQAIAARELSDASRWTDLIQINSLVWPFLTGDPAAAGPGVLLYGALIIVPAASAQVSAEVNPALVFGIDVSLAGGVLSDNGAGDFALVSGRDNLQQAIYNRLGTKLRELVMHLAYGCGVWSILGKADGPVAGQLGAQFVRDAMGAEKRVTTIGPVVATVVNDQVNVQTTVQPATGAPLYISTGG